MIKRLFFVTGFGVGFVVGSASGRKSYETLKQNALKTWNDPKVQGRVSEGADWVKSEVPVVGDKLAGGAKKAAGKASDATAEVKDQASGGSGGTDATDTVHTEEGDVEVPEPVTTDSPMEPAEPLPADGENRG